MTPGLGAAPPAPTRAEWNDDYRRGRWSYLTSATEAARYRVLAGLIGEQASVLDLGCGESILYAAIGGARRPGAYLGVDWSLEALRGDGWGAGHGVVCADAARPPTCTRFGIVLLNEVIYYLREPMDALARLRRHVAPGGSMLISTFLPREESQPRWARYIGELVADIEDRFPETERVATVESAGRHWLVLRLDGCSSGEWS